MPDYQEMYRKMVRASEAAINILIEAQRECEELYISFPEPEVRPLPRMASFKGDKKSPKDKGAGGRG